VTGLGDGFGFAAGECVVVTGAGSGIGRATARRAAELGLGVGIWDVDAAALDDATAEIGAAGAPGAPGVHACHVDVTDAAAVADAFASTAAALGRVRYLVNNAGPSSFRPRPFADGLTAAAGSVALVTDGWIAAGRERGDAVVSLSSVAGTFNGVGGQGWYPAAKAAIAGYTRFLAVQARGTFRANAVAPGLIATPRTLDFMTGEGAGIVTRNPMGRAGEPGEVAAVILFLLSPAASYVNGAIVPVDGGWLVVE
jgi:NAD(P)-dependent dehydrogenase (short-subunit alcohol dehydrogenase family)